MTAYHPVMSLSQLALALLALLASPGPTNTLLFVAGAERGFARSLSLILPVIAAYLSTVLPLTLVGAELLERWPVARPALMILAAFWVLWLAVRLWQSRSEMNRMQSVSILATAVTTLLNPKALIFGLVLLPSSERLAVNTLLFTALVAAISALWIYAGQIVAARANSDGKTLGTVRRLSALWLALVAAALILRGLNV